MGWLYKTKDFLCNCYIQPEVIQNANMHIGYHSWSHSKGRSSIFTLFCIIYECQRQIYIFFSFFLFCFIGHLIVVLSLMLDYHLTSEKRNCFSASTPNNSFGMFWWYITVCATLGFLIDCLCTNVVGFFLFLFL